MSASPPPSSSAVPPSSSSSSSSSASPPPNSQPNATADPPASSTPPPAASPPPSSAAPPPSISSPPPLLSASPPPPLASPPPASASTPPPASPSLPPPTASSPPPAASPPPPALSPPTPSPPSPHSQPLSPPPSSPPPPPAGSPPVVVSPPSPSKPQSPPPPPSSKPPKSPSQPPPSADPPAGSPPAPVSQSPPPLPSQTPLSNPSTPPPKNSPPSDPSASPPKNGSPTVPSPPSPPPSSSSDGGTPSKPSVPSPPTSGVSPPLPSPSTPSADPTKPVSPSDNVTVGAGGRNSTGSSGIKTGTIVPAVLAAGLVVLCLLGVAVWYKRRRRKQPGGYNAGFVMPSPFSSSQNSETSYPRSPTDPLVHHSSGTGSHGLINSPPNPGLGNSKSWFTYAELYKITDGFSAKNLLGEGGFGCVYKGCLADGREVAVKQLKAGSGQGEREFKAEVEIISRVHHRHLVSLVGYCIADIQRLLVYDYVPNDTLDYHLHEQGGTVLDWATRIKVAAGAARGIAYLHEDCHPRIIHRDIKSSNILLDSNFEAQVSDFGLARLAMDTATHVTTRVMGTFGYMAPEYASSGKLTDRSDVYSFGVVLLELITGRKPVDQSQPIGDESLVEWARPLLTQALDTRDFGVLPDPRLENYNENEMFRMIEAAAACVRHSASMRPKMGLVVRALDSLTETDLNNGVIPGQSELFAAPQSAEIRLFQRMAFGSQDYSDDFSRSSWRTRSESEGSFRP